MTDYKIKDLLKLPQRAWDEVKAYDGIMIINARKKHDSGYALMAIIGMNGNLNFECDMEIAAYCDAIQFNTPMGTCLKNDMLYPNGIMRFRNRGGRIEVGISVSSVDITLIPKQQ